MKKISFILIVLIITLISGCFGSNGEKDTERPIIKLIGNSVSELYMGDIFKDEGVMAFDNIDGDITSKVTKTIWKDQNKVSQIDVTTPGVFTIKYNVADVAGNEAETMSRTVKISVRPDINKPIIKLTGTTEASIFVGDLYKELGFKAEDDKDGDISDKVIITLTANNTTVSAINSDREGEFVIKYSVTDSSQNKAEDVYRKVKVINDTIPPTINLTGEQNINVYVGDKFEDLGCSALDNKDGNLTNKVSKIIYRENKPVAELTTTSPGIYIIKYTVKDNLGNEAKEVIRNVTVAYQKIDFTIRTTYSHFSYFPLINYDKAQIQDIMLNNEYIGTYPDSSFKVLVNRGENVISWNALYTDAFSFVRTVPFTKKVMIDKENGYLTISADLLSVNSFGHIIDTTSPIIKLKGESSVSIYLGDTYVEQGVEASDDFDGNISTNVAISIWKGVTQIPNVETSKISTITIKYNVSDKQGNVAKEVSREVNIVTDNIKPEIKLKGTSNVSIYVGDSYIDEGVIASDNRDGDISIKASKTVYSGDNPVSSIDFSKPGVFVVKYSVVDKSGNQSDVVQRVVNIIKDVTKPIISLKGSSKLNIFLDVKFEELGAEATDDRDGDISSLIEISYWKDNLKIEKIDTGSVGNYTIKYNVSDRFGNQADEIQRDISIIRDEISPEILLNGSEVVVKFVGSEYIDKGATATDNRDGDITLSIIKSISNLVNSKVVDSVDTSIPGEFIIKYIVKDKSGNYSKEISREVKIIESYVSAGSNYSMFLKTDGTLWASGYKFPGVIEGKTNGWEPSHELAPIKIMSGVAGVTCRVNHTFILKDDETVWACGDNEYGQLGDGTNTNSYIPIKIMSNVQSVSIGNGYSMILKTDGTLWACGDNSSGQLGDGTGTNRKTPVKIMSEVKSVSCSNSWMESDSFTMIIKTDGTLWACGSNSNGQLGNGTKNNSYMPIKIMSEVDSVTCGYYFTLILKKNGTVWACGENKEGQFGDGTTVDKLEPTQVMEKVKSISAGGIFSLFIKEDSTLWSCGYNYSGELGNGNNVSSSIPVKIMDDVKYVSAGTRYSLVIKNDKTLWAFGANDYGQLGDGTSTSKRANPVQIVY